MAVPEITLWSSAALARRPISRPRLTPGTPQLAHARICAVGAACFGSGQGPRIDGFWMSVNGPRLGRRRAERRRSRRRKPVAKIAASKDRDCSSRLRKSPEAPVAERADDAKVPAQLQPAGAHAMSASTSTDGDVSKLLEAARLRDSASRGDNGNDAGYGGMGGVGQSWSAASKAAARVAARRRAGADDPPGVPERPSGADDGGWLGVRFRRDTQVTAAEAVAARPRRRPR